MKTDNLTVTSSSQSREEPMKQSVLTYYWNIVKWMVKHRGEQNNRQKWRRMSREVRM